MNVTDKLMASISQTKDSQQVVRELAKKTLHHPHGCQCADCVRFNKEVNGAKETPPSVTDALVRGFKAAIRYGSGARTKPSGPKVGDAEGKRPRKRKLPIDEKLAGSLAAALKR